MEGPDQPRQRGLARGLIIAAMTCIALAACGPKTGAGAQAPAQSVAFSRGDLKSALDALAQAPAQGFAPGAFGDPARISALINDPARQDEGRAALRKGLIAYARAEHGLGLPRDQFPKEWGIHPAAYDAGGELDQAIGAHRFVDWLRGLPPPAPAYQALVRMLGAWRQAAARGGWPAIPGGAALRVGARGPRVAALRNRLSGEDPGLNAAAAKTAPDVYDGALARAVGQAQVRYGLKPTGIADSATLTALNVPAATRVNQIRANLERWRWLPRVLPATRVEVDAAGDTMDYYVDGAPAVHMLAASGKPGDETPILISAITQIEFNPPWRVPADIAEKELFPKEHAHPGYLARNHFVRGSGEAAPLVQEPGPKSALGKVKFEFDNPYGVYMHDTPAKSAFDLSQRQVSHGCVRLERAVGLARALLAPAGWSPERVDAAIASDDTSTVKLPTPIPVMFLYWTAQVRNGQMTFAQDPYGWDDIVVRLLDATKP
ncbi:MAG TPA: L,D-transpeptidase family protein [Caulobacteraceae bacterium]